jgi:hypothetical protein
MWSLKSSSPAAWMATTNSCDHMPGNNGTGDNQRQSPPNQIKTGCPVRGMHMRAYPVPAAHVTLEHVGGAWQHAAVH